MSEVTRESLGEALRQTIRASGQTQAAVARAVGSHPSGLSRIITGKRWPDFGHLQQIAAECGTEVETVTELARRIASGDSSQPAVMSRAELRRLSARIKPLVNELVQTALEAAARGGPRGRRRKKGKPRT